MPWLMSIISNLAMASLLALVAWLVQRRLRMHAVARTLWLLVLVKLVAPPMASLPVARLPAAVACALGLCNCPQHLGAQAIVVSLLLWALAAAWLAGAATAAWTAWRRWTHFQRLVANAHPAPPGWHSLATRICLELSVRRPPEMLVVPGRLPPMVVPGWGRARLLLPTDLLDQLNTSQRESLLLHELAHIKRGDHLVRMLELTVSIIFWWLPMVGLIGRQLRACEETCCDESVVAYLPHGRREYARLLLDVIDFASPSRQIAPQATAMSAASNLEQRLRAILDGAQRPRHAWLAGILTIGLAFAILPCGLRYEFAIPKAPAATHDACDPAMAAASSDHSSTKSPALCCPR